MLYIAKRSDYARFSRFSQKHFVSCYVDFDLFVIPWQFDISPPRDPRRVPARAVDYSKDPFSRIVVITRDNASSLKDRLWDFYNDWWHFISIIDYHYRFLGIAVTQPVDFS